MPSEWRVTVLCNAMQCNANVCADGADAAENKRGVTEKSSSERKLDRAASGLNSYFTRGKSVRRASEMGPAHKIIDNHEPIRNRFA